MKIIYTHGINDKSLYVDHKSNAINDNIEWTDFVQSTLDTDSWEVFTDKKLIPMFIPGELHANGRKTKENMKSRSGLIFDFDQIELTIEELKALFSEFEFLMYASTGNGIKPGLNARMVLPFATDIGLDEWEVRVPALKAAFPKPLFDHSAFTISQGQIVPSKIEGTVAFAIHNTGRFFDITEYEATLKPEEVFTQQSYNFNHDDVEVQLVIQTLVEERGGTLGRNQCWNIGQVLKNIGIYDVSIIERLRKPDSNTPASNAFTGNGTHSINYLRQYMPKGFKWPDFEEITLRKNLKKKPIAKTIEKMVDTSKYDQYFKLTTDQWLSDVVPQMTLGKVSIISATCGIGKTHSVAGGAFDVTDPLSGECIKTLMGAPLLLILKQNSTTMSNDEKDYNNVANGFASWQKIIGISDEEAARTILVIDEAHGLYLDGFKSGTNKQLMEQFNRFYRVILLSGTIEPEYFSNLKVDNYIRVEKTATFKKEIQRVYVPSYKNVAYVATKCIVDAGIRPVIIFHNNIKELKAIRKVLSELIPNYKLINITARADDKHQTEYMEFTKRHSIEEQHLDSNLSAMGYHGLIGTNSLVEGINIYDEIEHADVHIIGDVSLERIEQVTNRWRKCTDTIHVYHYTEACNVVPMIAPATIQDLVRMARDEARVKNEKYSLYDERMRMKKINTFSKQLNDENIYWDYEANCFDVDYARIDNTMSEIRESYALQNFSLYRETLESYGFKVRDPITRSDVIDLKEQKKEITEIMEDERIEVLETVAESFIDAGKWLVPQFSKQSEEYEVQKDFIGRFVKRGLRPSDVHEYIERLKKDKEYWRALNADLNDKKYGNEITQYIHKEIHNHAIKHNGGMYLSVEGKKALANKIVMFVFDVYYDGDINRTINLFGQMVSRVGGTLNISNRTQSPIEIINQFINIGKGSFVAGLDRKNGRVSKVLSMNRTGFSFNIQEVNDSPLEYVDCDTELKQELTEIMEAQEQLLNQEASTTYAITKAKKVA